MPRNRELVRSRLQEAALAMYRSNGFDQTTTARIAELAGVTERTFFRHFVDKREVLFDGESALSNALQEAVKGAATSLGPWETLLAAFQAAKPLLVGNRRLSEARRGVIESSPSLQERELAKTMALTITLAAALRERGVSDQRAYLAAQMGMAALGQALTSWLDGEPGDLEVHLAKTFREVRDLTS